MAQIAPYIFPQFFDNNGDPLNGGLIYAYAAGTTTPQDTYSNAAGTSANTNPIVLSSSGRTKVFLQNLAYDFVIKNSAGETIDSISGVGSAAISGGASFIDTISELRALASGAFNYVEVGGYAAKGDGGGGLFYWDATETAADLGVNVQPNSLPAAGRWIREYSGEINVKWFGAKGDTATDDLIAIAAANTYVASLTNGGTLYFPESSGGYLVTSNPSFNAKTFVRMESGAYFTSAGVAVTFGGGFSAGTGKVFSATVGAVSFSLVDFVRPEWWHDGGANWRPAIIAAYTTGLPVKLTSRTYTCDFTLGNFLLSSGATFEGEGYNSVIEATSADARPFQNVNRTGPTLTDENITLRNFRIVNNRAASTSEFSHGVDFRYVAGVNIENVWVQDTYGDGVSFRGCEDVATDNIRVKNIRRQGLAVTLGSRISINNIFGEDCDEFLVDVEPNEFDTISKIDITNVYCGSGVAKGGVNAYSEWADAIQDINVDNVDSGTEMIIRGVLRGSFSNIKVDGGLLSGVAAIEVFDCKQLMLRGLYTKTANLEGTKLKISSCTDVSGGDFFFKGPGTAANGPVMELLSNTRVTLDNINLTGCNTQGLWARNNTGVIIDGILIDGATQYAVLLNPNTSNTGFRVTNGILTNCTSIGVRLDQGSGTNLGVKFDFDYGAVPTPVSIAGGGLLTWATTKMRGSTQLGIVALDANYDQVTPGPTMDATGLAIFNVGIKVDGGVAGVRRMWFDAVSGVTHRAGAGSSYDWAVLSQGSAYLLRNPTGTGNLETVGKFGFGAGAGGTVVQATDKTTGVTLSKQSGRITMNAAALAAGTIVSFTLTNTLIAATDLLILNHFSGGTIGAYSLNAQCGAGSAVISIRNNTAGSLAEAVVISFALISGAIT